MKKKKIYIPPYIDFSLIEEDTELLSVSGEGKDMPSEGEWDAKANTLHIEKGLFDEERFGCNFDNDFWQ